jgi:hypothetical protein
MCVHDPESPNTAGGYHFRPKFRASAGPGLERPGPRPNWATGTSALTATASLSLPLELGTTLPLSHRLSATASH